MSRICSTPRRHVHCVASFSISLLGLLPGSDAAAQGSLLRSAGGVLVEAVGRRAASAGARSAAEELAEAGGEAAVRSLAGRLASEGGDASLEAAARLITEHGALAIRALDDLPNPGAVVRAVERLPADQVPRGLARLAASAGDQELATMVARHGSAVLQLELRHPGLATPLFRAYGDDAARLGNSLEPRRLYVLAQYADDIAALPAAPRNTILTAIRRDADRVAQFLGDFARANPGKTLAAGGAVAVLTLEAERILGGEVVLRDQDGESRIVSRPGLIGRLTGEWVRAVRPDRWWLVVTSTAVALVIVVRAWRGAVRRRR